MAPPLFAMKAAQKAAASTEMLKTMMGELMRHKAVGLEESQEYKGGRSGKRSTGGSAGLYISGFFCFILIALLLVGSLLDVTSDWYPAFNWRKWP